MYECFLGLLKKKKKSRLARGKTCCMLTIKWHLVFVVKCSHQNVGLVLSNSFQLMTSFVIRPFIEGIGDVKTRIICLGYF
jgi:hypothetical protein